MNSSIKKTMGMTAFVLAFAGCATTPSVRDSDTTYMKDAMGPVVEQGLYPGFISVLYNDGVQETACVGYADVEKKRPIAMDQAFQQCSQTKGFCGVTIAKLVEEGKISLDDPVSKYLPEFQNTMYRAEDDMNWTWVVKRSDVPITVRMVMNHTAGFDFELAGKDEKIPGGGWTGGMPLRIVAAEASKQVLNFKPGTQMRYSNTGIDVGAAIVEVVSGMKWEDYLQKYVFDPLEMKDTTFWPTDEQIKNRINIYACETNAPCVKHEAEGWAQMPFNDAHVHPSAGAGIWTTANDQLKFYKMLMNLGVGENGVRVLKEDTVKNLLAASTRPRAADGSHPLGEYSLGLWCNEKTGWFGHGGAWGTNCEVNWKTKQLKLWVCQTVGWSWKLVEPMGGAQEKFFKTDFKRSDSSAYTGRMK